MLDVLEDEQLVERVATVGARMLDALGQLPAARVRGVGLLVGVELESGERAEQAVDGMRELGVLIGRTGRAGNVLKIRPPLVFGDEHADLLVTALSAALG